MTGSAYRELEKTLENALEAFSNTKQKLNAFERMRRERVAVILGNVVRKRRQREKHCVALSSDACR